MFRKDGIDTVEIVESEEVVRKRELQPHAQHPTRRTLLDHRVVSHSYSWRFDAEPGVSVAAGSEGCES